MGIYLNPGADLLLEAKRDEIYVDKSALIEELNKVYGKSRKYVCVSRPRRFGKTMAANMVCAYYDRTVGREVFDGLAIARKTGASGDRGTCDVLRINMQEFLSEAEDMEGLLAELREALLWELLEAYDALRYRRKDNLRLVMETIYAQTQRPFVIVIDEWDCIFREYPHDTAAQRKYLDFLRDWLKDKAYIGLAYMTGILPVKKYGTH
ncbi:MAG: AAA family ATPase [Selenomonas sp.]|nr:AAA family ATPase [Selenomonas sp.]